MRNFIYLSLLFSFQLFADRTLNMLIRPLTNSGELKYSWFSAGFAHSVNYNLGIVQSVNLQSLKDLGEAYGLVGELSKAEIRKIPKKLNIDLMVSGTYQMNGNDVTLNIKLQSSGESKKTASFTVSDSFENIENLEIKFIKALIEESNKILPTGVANCELTQIEEHKIELNKIKPLAFENYSKALSIQIKNPKEAMKLFREAIKDSEDFPALYLAAGEHASLRLPFLEEALLDFRKLSDIQRKRKEEDTYNYPLMLHLTALTYFRKGDMKNSLANYIRAKQAYDKQDITGIKFAEILNNLGDIYLNAGNYDKAIESLLNAKRIFETFDLTDSLHYANVLSSIGAYYFEYEKGSELEHLEEAKILYEKGSYTVTVGYANCLTNMGNHYLLENDGSHAIEKYLQALDIHRKLGSTKTFSYASLLNSIGIIYMHKGELNKAGELFEKSKTLLENLKLEESWTYASALINLSNTYYLQKNKERFKKNIRLEWKMQKQVINSQTQNAD